MQFDIICKNVKLFIVNVHVIYDGEIEIHIFIIVKTRQPYLRGKNYLFQLNPIENHEFNSIKCKPIT